MADPNGRREIHTSLEARIAAVEKTIASHASRIGSLEGKIGLLVTLQTLNIVALVTLIGTVVTLLARLSD